MNEDLFLEQSEPLCAFVSNLRASWDPVWGTFGPELPERLHSALGDGLVSFLWTDRKRRLVTKSPSVVHLERFFSFFPSARLLILVRDGRSVVQSAMQTFGWSLDRGGRAWAEAAETIRRFQGTEAERAERWRLVRYEDLVDDTEGQLRTIFAFLELDASRYDFEAARNLPVRGSSAFGVRDGSVDWRPVPKNASFQPKDRWREWTTAQLERFDWIAGKQLVTFDYAASTPRFHWLLSIKHTLLDWRYQSSKKARLTFYRTRVRLSVRSRISDLLRSLRIRPAPR